MKKKDKRAVKSSMRANAHLGIVFVVSAITYVLASVGGGEAGGKSVLQLART